MGTPQEQPVYVDPARCRGHARCLAVAPDAFDYDESVDKAVVLPEAVDTDPDLLELAVRSCPERAISMTGAHV
jgi:ferredoxin